MITIDQIFRPRKDVADQVLQQTIQAVATPLYMRGKSSRNQVKDNELFGPVTAAMVEMFNAGEVQLAIKLGKFCYELAKKYETDTGGEVHKGTITFDLALVHLALDDFAAAMRYFEIAEFETRATEKSEHPNQEESHFALFRSNLFERNVWDRIDGLAKLYPLATYQALWGTAVDKAVVKDDWDHLSDNSKLLYVITSLQRMRYHELAAETTWDRANSLHLAHWNLAADVGRVVETELKCKRQCPAGSSAKTLGAMLEQCFKHTTKPANLSKLQIDLHAKLLVSDAATFDAAFETIRAGVESGATWEERIANAVYLLRATRNQVAHSVDDSMVLFTDPEAAKFTVDVLLSLCHVEGWTN